MKRLADSRGLLLLGVASLRPSEQAFARYRQWLDEGRQAGMTYLEDHLPLRADPRTLLPSARMAVVVGLRYYQGDLTPRRSARERPRIAQYARLKDYHRYIWRQGESMLAELHTHYDTAAVGRVVTDSAPLLERDLAARAGGGFIGKNTCLIQPDGGSFLLLGELLTSMELPTTERAPVDPTRRGADGGCGTCRRCQVHCPTGALDVDYRIDARRCLSYWTIEHRGSIPEEFWPWLGTYIFGCDICQLVCPYNRGLDPAPVAPLLKITETPPLFDIATLTPVAYERLFGGTPVTRAKRTGLMRNALIAMTVTHDPRLDEAILLAAERGDDVVRATLEQIARWRARNARPAQD